MPTLYFASIWGPILLAIGIGIFVSRNHYIQLYRNLEKETLAVLLFGILAIGFGIFHIMSHNVWGSLAEVIISLIGWGLLIKGALFAIVPKFVERAGEWEAKSKLIPVVGVVLIVIGVYLSWISYFV